MTALTTSYKQLEASNIDNCCKITALENDNHSVRQFLSEMPEKESYTAALSQISLLKEELAASAKQLETEVRTLHFLRFHRGGWVDDVFAISNA